MWWCHHPLRRNDNETRASNSCFGLPVITRNNSVSRPGCWWYSQSGNTAADAVSWETPKWATKWLPRHCPTLVSDVEYISLLLLLLHLLLPFRKQTFFSPPPPPPPSPSTPFKEGAITASYTSAVISYYYYEYNVTSRLNLLFNSDVNWSNFIFLFFFFFLFLLFPVISPPSLPPPPPQ